MATSSSYGGVALPPSPEKIQSKFDLSIAIALFTWPALTLAVQNSWGGPQAAEKREWFGGAVSELFESMPDADVEYVEEFLLQVMNDEFEAHLEDGSAEEVAAKIVGLRKMTLQGDFALVDEMQTRWEARQRSGGFGKLAFVDGEDEDQDTDGDSIDMEDDGGYLDMGEAPELTRVPREKPPPEVDDEGFTKIAGRRKH